jgi:mannose-6-phosphate isomerase
MLRDVFGRKTPRHVRIGESWDLADLPEDRSVVANGELAGRTLRSVIEEYPAGVTGREDFEPPFGLLVKFLDCGRTLSVQVHPDASACRRMGRGDPKTECWYIVAAGPGSVLYKGLKRGTTKRSFARAIKAGTVEKTLDRVEVKAGECHFLPAGTVHAVGAGLLIAEIQLPSDTTYRVFDWNRLSPEGKPRPLHVAEALESINFDISAQDLPVNSIGRLVDCEFFTVDKGHQAKGCELLLRAGEVKVLVFLGGMGRIEHYGGGSIQFAAGEVFLVPAAYEGAAVFTAETEYLTVKGIRC